MGLVAASKQDGEVDDGDDDIINITIKKGNLGDV